MNNPTRKCSDCNAPQSDVKPLFAYDLAHVPTHKLLCAACVAGTPGAKATYKVPSKNYNVNGSNPSGE
jgi:hypothetical protein